MFRHMQNKTRRCNSGTTASQYVADARYSSRTRAVGHVSLQIRQREDYSTTTHKKWKEIASLSINNVSTRLRTGAFVAAQEVIQSKEKRLLIALRTASHPVTLHHEFNRFLGSRQNGIFRFFLDFDDLLTTILGEKDTCVRSAARSHSRKFIFACVWVNLPCVSLCLVIGIIVNVIIN